MEIVINDFNDRVLEIEAYYTFVEGFDNNKVLLCNSETDNICPINTNIYKMLKANLYLLLYNVAEYSFKNALEHLCDQVNKRKFHQVKEEFKKLHLKKKYKNFGDSWAPRDNGKTISRDNCLLKKIETISDDVIEIKFDKMKEVSGNLNPDKIKALAKEYGFSSSHLTSKKAPMFFVVEKKRNSLAHGDTSFSECGGENTIKEIKVIKSETIDYMKSVLNIIKEFIDNKSYDII